MVDDGSKDKTSQLVLELAQENKNLKCLKLVRNRGKGHAIKMGFMASRGKMIFFADADRAMPFPEFEKIYSKFQQNSEKYPDLIVVGSRAHLEKVFFKNLLAWWRCGTFCTTNKIRQNNDVFWYICKAYEIFKIFF